MTLKEMQSSSCGWRPQLHPGLRPLMDSALNKNSNHRIGVFDSESERPQKPTEVSPWRNKGKTQEREGERERGAMTRRSLAVDNLVWEQLICQ